MNGELTEYRHQFIRNYSQSWGKEEYIITARDPGAMITIGAYNTERKTTRFRIRNFSVDRVKLR